jgi:hypothetical protein
VLKDPKTTWELLEQAGADPSTTDSQGRIAAYYIDHPNEIEMPDTRDLSGSFRRFTSGKNGVYMPEALKCVSKASRLIRVQLFLFISSLL